MSCDTTLHLTLPKSDVTNKPVQQLESSTQRASEGPSGSYSLLLHREPEVMLLGQHSAVVGVSHAQLQPLESKN